MTDFQNITEDEMKIDKKGNENNENEGVNDRKLTEFDIIEESGSVVARNREGAIHCLSIIGQVEGHYILPEGQKATKYEHILPSLVSVEQDEEIDGILILLNTMGGDVEAGLAIAEVIASMKKPTVSVVLGGGHSIGVPLAVASKRSFIVPSATMTIHPVRINGLVVGVPQTFTYFQEMQKRIIEFICAHSRADKDKIYELMMRPDMMATDVGSIIEGREAVEYGIIDEVGGLDKALESLKQMIRENK
jgi:ATP-dependent protease ClpP protease subunit